SASAGPTKSRPRNRPSNTSGDLTSQSLMGSLSGDLSERCGILVQEANEAPADSTSVWLQRSPSTRTSCPRATSRRTMASIGGVFPPPSQCAKRKRLLALATVMTAPPSDNMADVSIIVRPYLQSLFSIITGRPLADERKPKRKQPATGAPAI